MGELSAILRSVASCHVAFWCPGCSSSHVLRVEGEERPCWGYNGNADKPTFTPSILVTYNGANAGRGRAPPAVCHSFVTDGRIQFLGDCTHDLAGQTVDLPAWPD